MLCKPKKRTTRWRRLSRSSLASPGVCRRSADGDVLRRAETLERVRDGDRAIAAAQSLGQFLRSLLERGISKRLCDYPAELPGRGFLVCPHARAGGDYASGVVGLVAPVGNTDERHTVHEGRVDRLPAGVRHDERGVREYAAVRYEGHSAGVRRDPQ